MSLFASMVDYLNGFKREFTMDESSTPYTVVPEADRISMINEAREEISIEILTSPEKGTISTTIGTKEYVLSSIISNCILVDAVYYGSKKLQCVPTREDYYYSNFLTSNTEPDYFFLKEDNNSVCLIPGPDKATKLTVFGYTVPSTLGATTSETAIPIYARRAVIPYALWKAYSRESLNEANPGTAANAANKYKTLFELEMRRALQRHNKARSRGKRGKINFEGYNPHNFESYS